MKAKLIVYGTAQQPIAVQNQLRKQLNGHNDTSHGGKYKYRRPGILDTIPHLKPSRNTLIVPLKEAKQITTLLKKHHAKVQTYSIEINKSKLKK